MGRLTYMSALRARMAASFAVGATVILSSCSLEAPVSISDRPLSERMEELRDDPNLDAASDTETAPASLAFGQGEFGQALAEGDLLRLMITEAALPAPLRSGPGSSYDRIADVPSGTDVLATGNQTGEWVQVLYGDFEGWIRSLRISTDAQSGADQIVDADAVEATPVTYEVNGDAVGVNIRSEPDAGSDLISGAPVGTTVVGTGHTEGTWIEVIYEGVTGWASGNYLEPIARELDAPSDGDSSDNA